MPLADFAVVFAALKKANYAASRKAGLFAHFLLDEQKKMGL
jgi:hypothetical protein